MTPSCWWNGCKLSWKRRSGFQDGLPTSPPRPIFIPAILPVPQVRIEALSDAQIQEFLALYCPAHHAALWDHLAGSPQLEVLRSPYFLKLLVVQTTAGEIPAGRAALFGGFARQALQREIEADNLLFQPGVLLSKRDRHRFGQPRNWKTPHELPRHGLLFDQLIPFRT